MSVHAKDIFVAILHIVIILEKKVDLNSCDGSKTNKNQTITVRSACSTIILIYVEMRLNSCPGVMKNSSMTPPLRPVILALSNNTWFTDVVIENIHGNKYKTKQK